MNIGYPERSLPGPSAAAAQSGQGSPAVEVIDLALLVAILRRRIAIVVATVMLGIAVALAYLLTAKPLYTAAASVLLDTRQQRVLAAESVLPGLDADLSVIESQVEIMRSARIARRVIKTLKLDVASGPAEPPGLLSRASSWFRNLFPAPAPPSGDAVAKPSADDVPIDLLTNFLRSVSIERRGLSYIIEVGFTDKSPADATRVANAIVDAYLADQLEAKFFATRQANNWLKDRLVDLGEELRQDEKEVQRYRAEHNIVDIGEQTLSQREIMDFSLQLVAARTRVAEAKARLVLVERLAADPTQFTALDKALQSSVISDYRRQYAEVQRKIGELVGRYGNQHPLVDSAKAELDNIAKEIEFEAKRIVQSARNDFEISRTQVAILESGLESLKREFATIDADSIKLAELKRNAAASSNLYDSMLRRFKETQAQESLQSPDARVVAYATPPEFASSPKKLTTLALGALGSLCLGIMLALLRDHTDRVFRTPEDVGRVLSLPHVASLPAVDPYSLRPVLPSDQHVGDVVHANARRVVDDERSLYTQSLYAIRQWIESAHRGRQAPVVVVMSPAEGEGRTSLAVNLACFAALSGVKTLLIDTDFHNPAMAGEMLVRPGFNLLDILSGESGPAAGVGAIDNGQLDLCPGVGLDEVKYPLRLAASTELASFLERMRASYGLIVMDSSPLVPFMTARPLIDRTDLAIMVLDWSRTTHDAALQGLRNIEHAGGRPVGVVINRVKLAGTTAGTGRRRNGRRERRSASAPE